MTATLQLNANYMPMTLISSRDALGLVLTDKARTLETTGKLFHSQHLTVEEPSVIILNEYAKVPFKSLQPSRRNILARDNHVCQFTHCNREATTIEHVQPTSRGGITEWTNVVGACSPCNAKKANKTLAEIGWRLKKVPRPPLEALRMDLIYSMAHKSDRSDWIPYMEDWVSEQGRARVLATV